MAGTQNGAVARYTQVLFRALDWVTGKAEGSEPSVLSLSDVFYLRS